MNGPPWHFVIHGRPVPKARNAFARGRFAKVTLAPKSVSWEGAAAGIMAARWDGAAALSEPLQVEVWAIVERPKRLRRRKDPPGLLWRTEKPDADNVLKSVCDALTKGGVIEDDKIIVRKVVASLYAEADAHARVVVSLEPIRGTPENGLA